MTDSPPQPTVESAHFGSASAASDEARPSPLVDDGSGDTIPNSEELRMVSPELSKLKRLQFSQPLGHETPPSVRSANVPSRSMR